MQEHNIKHAEASDMEKILKLQYAAYQSEALIHGVFTIQPLTQTLDEVIAEYNRGIVLKAVQDGEIIGSVRAYAEGNTAFIGKLMVHPKHQGKGLGKQLLAAIEKEFPHKRYELFTSCKSDRNLSIYETVGYTRFREGIDDVGIKFAYLEKINSVFFMKKDKISVIIPVFNARERLAPLLENLFSQNDADKVEFIFIDDHSADDSYQILERAVRIFGNIRLLQMEKNSGPAVCRNSGIEHASGDYLCFVDDDDTLGEPYGFVDRRLTYIPELKYKFFENMYPLLGKSDIILCRRVMIEPDLISHCKSPNDTDEKAGRLPSYERAQYMHAMQYICGSLFRRKMLIKHNIRFIPGLEPNEDVFFGSLSGYYAKTIKTACDSVYGYHSRPDSLSHSEGDKMRMQKLLLYGNRQLPILLSHLLLKDAKHNELCRFVYEFRYSTMRLTPLLVIQGVDVEKYSFIDSFPRMCLDCEHIKAVCTGLTQCPKTGEFEQFIKKSAKKFLPKNFDITSI